MIIWANLDCEARWGGTTLPQHVLRRISAAAVALAAFAPDGEPVELYVPAAIDPARVKLPGVTLRAGVPARWDLAWADPDAKAVNDRRVGFALREELGCALPGSRVIESLAELDAHLASMTGRWVCKAPWTAAGRDRAHGDGPLAGEQRVYVGRMLDRFGALVFEPWLDRISDFGVTVPGGIHTLHVDPRGAFTGIDLADPALLADERAQLDRVVAAAGAALAARGYTGPYTVDAFVYRDGDARKLDALCELNARYTFGHVARALAVRFGTRALGFGPPPDGATILVEPDAGDPVTVWTA